MVARAITVLILGIVALAIPPAAVAAPVESSGCNMGLPTNCAVPDEDLRLICNSVCPNWTRLVCWDDIGLICDDTVN